MEVNQWVFKKQNRLNIGIPFLAILFLSSLNTIMYLSAVKKPAKQQRWRARAVAGRTADVITSNNRRIHPCTRRR